MNYDQIRDHRIQSIRQDHWPNCCSRTVLIFLFSLALIASLFLLANKKLSSVPTLPSFSLSSSFLSGYTLTSQFIISNPNEKTTTTFYDDVVFSLSYNGFNLSEARADAFDQKGSIATNLELSFRDLDVLVVDGAGLSGRVLNLGLTGRALVVFRDGNWSGRYGKIEVQCDNLGVLVAFDGSSGKMQGYGGDGGECRVECIKCGLHPWFLDVS